MAAAGDHSATRPDHRLERLVFFSDAVFAIAITLLVIEIHVPTVGGETDADFLQALWDMAPRFIGFVVSFAVIGAFWAGHHRAFACAAQWDAGLVPRNLLLLGLIAAGPFFSAFASDYPGQRVPVASYALWLLATALTHLWLQWRVTHPPVVGRGVAPDYLAGVRRRAWAIAAGAATALAVALAAPGWALLSLFSIMIWRRLFDLLATPRLRPPAS